jgi:UDP-N-acetylmuramoylalanine--D-glutamate ligase
VVECSSYQIDLAPSINPTAGILLNLTPDHLDRHGTMQHYASIKERLVAGSDTAIVGVDDIYCAQIADRLERAGKEVVRISKRLPLPTAISPTAPTSWRPRGPLRAHRLFEGIGSLRGQHNAQNALAAVAACLKVGLDLGEIQSGLESFPRLAHRMEQVGRKGQVLFVNDSKATNADAAAPALSSFQRIYWIAGGLGQGRRHRAAARLFPRIAKAYLIGEAAPAFSATLGETVPYEISGTLGSCC